MSHRPWESPSPTPSPYDYNPPPPPPPNPPHTLPPLNPRLHPTSKRKRRPSYPPAPLPSIHDPLYTTHTPVTLGHLATEVYNAVQELCYSLGPPAPGNPHPPPPVPVTPASFTLDAIAQRLESICILVSTRATSLTHPPPQKQCHTWSADPQLQQPLKTERYDIEDSLARTQRRTEQLEKRVHVLEADADAFSLERERLVQNIEILEETVAEIREERDGAIEELREGSKQWGEIVVNAARIEDGYARQVDALRNSGGGSEGEGGDGRLRRRVEVLEGLLEKVRVIGGERRGLVMKAAELEREEERWLGGACAGVRRGSGGEEL